LCRADKICSTKWLYDFKKIHFLHQCQGRVEKIYLGSKENKFAAKLFIRLIATLEMVLKDPDSDIIVRYGNREDFKAAVKLLETVTLPTYLGIIFPKPLLRL